MAIIITACQLSFLSVDTSEVMPLFPTGPTATTAMPENDTVIIIASTVGAICVVLVTGILIGCVLLAYTVKARQANGKVDLKDHST